MYVQFERRTEASAQVRLLRPDTYEPFEQGQQMSAESGEGRLWLKENTFPFDTYPTQSGTARVPRVGECADKRYVWPRFICEKNRMR